MTVELIYDPDCPNVAQARANLVQALAASGREVRWSEWGRTADDSPAHVRDYGSPTVLVAGRDAAGEPAGADGACCRLYRDGHRPLAGAPSVAQIAAALGLGASAPAPTTASASPALQGSLMSVPGIALAFLPKLACPACWPALSGLFASLGLGFLLDATYLLPLTAGFLALAVGALAFRARRRRGYGPFAVGLLAAAIVLAGKFLFESDAALYGGIALLVAASLRNAWPVRSAAAACPTCLADSSAPATLQEESAS